MIYISKIEISHFRSIYELRVDEISDVNVISGANDVGKSNIIKALNLFFNYKESPVSFQDDTNSFHTYFSKNARKRKFIAVRLTFRRPKGKYPDSLSEYFWVKRQWDRDFPVEPETTWGKDGNSTAEEDWPQGLTWFLKKSRFLYVPAIRDRNYFRQVLATIYREITERRDEELKTAGDSLLKVIASRSTAIRAALQNVTGLEFTFEMPDDVFALLSAAGLYTDNNIPFHLRGDGLQALTVPGLMQSLSNLNKTYYYVWGFEEPENSLEYKRATALADMIRDTYSKKAQVFLTTHSPAFLAMENAKTSIFRVTKREQKYVRKKYVEQVTDIQPVFVRGDFRENLLPRDLGLLLLARQFDRDNRAVDELEAKVDALEERIRLLSKPILIVEGPNDEATLAHAWEQLYEETIPFDILVAHGVKEVPPLVKRFALPEEKRMCALCDHDKTGVGTVKNLLKSKFIDNCNGLNRSVYKCNMLAMTLPPPDKNGGVAQAENLNLALEFYFPDRVLLDIDSRSGGKLFSQNRYVHVGKHEDILDDLRDTITSLMKYKLLVDDGKSFLVRNLSTLNAEDFLAIHELFVILVSHLLPNYEFTIRPRILEMLAARETSAGV